MELTAAAQEDAKTPADDPSKKSSKNRRARVSSPSSVPVKLEVPIDGLFNSEIDSSCTLAVSSFPVEQMPQELLFSQRELSEPKSTHLDPSAHACGGLKDDTPIRERNTPPSLSIPADWIYLLNFLGLISPLDVIVSFPEVAKALWGFSGSGSGAASFTRDFPVCNVPAGTVVEPVQAQGIFQTQDASTAFSNSHYFTRTNPSPFSTQSPNYQQTLRGSDPTTMQNFNPQGPPGHPPEQLHGMNVPDTLFQIVVEPNVFITVPETRCIFRSREQAEDACQRVQFMLDNSYNGFYSSWHENSQPYIP